MNTTSGRVMVVAAHPDDPEFLAGGTVARLAKEGRELTYVIVTNGNKGSGDRSVTSEQLRTIAPQLKLWVAFDKRVVNGWLRRASTPRPGAA